MDMSVYQEDGKRQQVEATLQGMYGFDKVDATALLQFPGARALPQQEIVFNGNGHGGKNVPENGVVPEVLEPLRGIGVIKRNGSNAGTVVMLETRDEIDNLIGDLAKDVGGDDTSKRDDVEAYIDYLRSAERDNVGRIKGVRHMKLKISGVNPINIDGDNYPVQHLVPPDCRDELHLPHRNGENKDRLMFIFYKETDGREVVAIEGLYPHSDVNHKFSTRS